MLHSPTWKAQEQEQNMHSHLDLMENWLQVSCKFIRIHAFSGEHFPGVNKKYLAPYNFYKKNNLKQLISISPAGINQQNTF